jgi:excisionase family DNA binding protein
MAKNTLSPSNDLGLGAACAVTGISEKTIPSKIASGDLAAFRVGRALRIEPDELHRFVAARRVPVTPKAGARP